MTQFDVLDAKRARCEECGALVARDWSDAASVDGGWMVTHDCEDESPTDAYERKLRQAIVRIDPKRPGPAS
jgi:hypothetical protein